MINHSKEFWKKKAREYRKKMNKLGIKQGTYRHWQDLKDRWEGLDPRFNPGKKSTVDVIINLEVFHGISKTGAKNIQSKLAEYFPEEPKLSIDSIRRGWDYTTWRRIQTAGSTDIEALANKIKEQRIKEAEQSGQPITKDLIKDINREISHEVGAQFFGSL